MTAREHGIEDTFKVAIETLHTIRRDKEISTCLIGKNCRAKPAKVGKVSGDARANPLIYRPEYRACQLLDLVRDSEREHGLCHYLGR